MPGFLKSKDAQQASAGNPGYSCISFADYRIQEIDSRAYASSFYLSLLSSFLFSLSFLFLPPFTCPCVRFPRLTVYVYIYIYCVKSFMTRSGLKYVRIFYFYLNIDNLFLHSPRLSLYPVNEVFVSTVPLVNISVVEGKPAELPCDITPPGEDTLHMVFWFKDEAGVPLYT